MNGSEDEYFVYTKVTPENVAYLRQEAKENQKTMIMHCARYGLFEGVFSPEEILAARTKGILPKGWSCHHIIPLSGGGNNNASNLCFITRDFHNSVEIIYRAITGNLNAGESAKLPFLGLNDESKIFTAETPAYQQYIADVRRHGPYQITAALDGFEMNKAARRRMEEESKNHNPTGVALGNMCKTNISRNNAKINVAKAINASATYSKDCRLY